MNGFRHAECTYRTGGAGHSIRAGCAAAAILGAVIVPACGGGDPAAPPAAPVASTAPTPVAAETSAPAAAPAAAPDETAGPWFTEITDTLHPPMIHDAGAEGDYHYEEIMTPGCGLFDYDNDGRLDIYFVNGGVNHRRGPGAPEPDPATLTMDRLYRQLEDGSFADVTEASGLRATRYGMGCAVGDYDNDGDLDIYLPNFGPDQLWRNNGDGTFTDVTEASGIVSDLWSVTGCFFDYDRDGLLDLYVTDYLLDANAKQCFDLSGRLDYCGPTACLPARDKLFHNEGGGRFRDVSEASGIASLAGRGLGVVCADFDDDGWIDLYVANDANQNFLWINKHDGTFEDAATLLGCAYNRDGSVEAGMGVTTGDADGDGKIDVFVTHLKGETNTMYRGGVGGSYVDATDASGLGFSSTAYTGFGTGLIDFDHDTDLDLIIVGGAVKRRSHVWPGAETAEFWKIYAEPNLFFINQGNGRYADASKQAGAICTRVEVTRGLALGDIDGDGDLDAVLAQADGPCRVYRNDMPKQGRSLIVRAVDPALNRDAIGAVVSVTAGGRTQVRTISASLGYASSSPPVAHFGLGPAAGIEKVTIRWPDGMMEQFAGPFPDPAVELRRGSGDVVVAAREAGT
jgi:hypothetical protein